VDAASGDSEVEGDMSELFINICFLLLFSYFIDYLIMFVFVFVF
jgi:hypothetical protein